MDLLMQTIDQVLNEARARELSGDVAGATRVLDQAPEAVRTGAWYFARGAMSMQAGRVDDALKRFEEAVAKEPEVPEYRGNLGAALLELARAGDAKAKARALTELELAAQWGPTLPSVHTNLAVARLISGDAQGALEAATQALKLDPQHLPALYNKAAALSALGQLEACLVVLDQVLARAPGLPAAVASRVATLKKLGRATS
jgi:tetratricopeptide (TPR) repeat protein